MNRLPRRPQRIQPPLRGRAAAVPPLGQIQQCYMPVLRQHPSISGPFTRRESHRNGCVDIHPSWLKLYKQWSGLFKVLDRPWKWLVALASLVILSIMIGSLL